MVEMDGDFPQYGFAQHKGYVTPEHTAALRAHGPCPQHRHLVRQRRWQRARCGLVRTTRPVASGS